MKDHTTKYKPGLIHVAVWIVILCVPLFILNSPISMRSTLRDTLLFCIISASIMAVFYANYSFLVDRYLLQHRLWTFLGCNLLLLIAVACIVQWLFNNCFYPALNPPQGNPVPASIPETGWPHPGPQPIPFIAGNIILYLLTIGISIAIRMIRKWYLAEAARKEAEHIQLQAELQSLKRQINPHFLFNTLNNIYSFVLLNPEQAQRSLEELCRLLRYMLYECNKPTVTLDAEIDFLRDYVELARIRLPQQTQLTVSLPEEPSRKSIAPLLFIALFENAFKYGTSSEHPSFISIEMRETGNTLTCVIMNRYFPKDNVPLHPGPGIGLSNLRKRLEILYPGHHQFSCQQNEDCYRVDLCVELDGLVSTAMTEITGE